MKEIGKVKPILIATIPEYGYDPDFLRDVENSFLKSTNYEYHVIVIGLDNIEGLDFQVFYEKDFTEVKFDELKKIVKERLKTMV